MPPSGANATPTVAALSPGELTKATSGIPAFHMQS